MFDNFEQLKRDVESVQSQIDRAVGGREQLLKRLKKDYGIDGVEEAEAELEQAKDDEINAARRYRKRYDVFEAAFRKKLKELEDE
jgi:hypothetical protein